MKIALTGAGGGHFYPLIAVAERVQKEAFAQNLEQPEIFFFSDKPYDEQALYSISCKFIEIPAGKLRVYFSLQNIADLFKTAYGCLVALVKMYSIYPDVLFAKGGYASFPVLVSARILSIPVVVHESDTVPGRTTKWAGGFATRVAVSYQEASRFYPKEIVALTGQPIRDVVLPPHDFTKTYTKKDRPTILVLGGSQGSQTINNAFLKILPALLSTYDIVHQAGKDNLDEVKKVTEELLKDHPYKDHYYVEGFIDVALLYPKIDIVITRAGSSMFEMILWRIPIIAIPIPETISRDQRTNAYTIASRGLATVIEENNLTPNILTQAITRILENPDIYNSMIKKAEEFEYVRNSATVIARELIKISLSHK
jgi:UDP-N-acetylglucosamine--N-acetylmuramyl-(pentapeptide) pyrophosphoryl-undecaprenol N-acetylglucosamine transferase